MIKLTVVLILLICINSFVMGDNDVDPCPLQKNCYHCVDNSKCGWCESRNLCYSKVLNQTSSCPEPLATGCKFFTKMLIVATLLIFFACMLGAGGGIGGGAMYTPILMLILGMTAHQAIPIAKITISGVGIGSYMITARIKHPKANRPLIDYDLANIFEPAVLLGTIVGVYLNVTFPSYLIVVTLAVTLTISAYRTISKGVKLYKEEVAKDKLKNINEEERPLKEGIHVPKPEMQTYEQSEVNSSLSLLEQKDAKTFPMKKIFTILFVFAVLMVLVLLKGSQTGKSIIGVSCGTWQFWLILGSSVPFVVAVTFLVARKLRNRHEEKILAGFKFLAEDIKYTPKVTVYLPVISFFAGIGAGFLGIGAGMILGPVMIELGVIPQIAAATSAFTLIFTASSTSLQFIILGKLVWQAALFYWGVGFFAAILGQKGVAWLVKKYNKQSYVNFLIAFAIIISTIALVSVQVIGIVHDIKAHQIPSFNGICSSKGPSSIF